MQPLLLVFEDLHWIDAETQALLDSLVESLPTARILLLVNYRPEYQHGWGSKTYYTQLRLDPLPPASAEALLACAAGGRSRASPAQAALDRADRGQPVLPGGERPDAGGDRGAGRRARRLSPGDSRSPTLQVPATVQAVLAARIDRLPPEEKRLLQTAAVIGKDVPFALLQAIAELPEEALHRGLAHLQAAEFLYETQPLPRARLHLQARPHPRGGLRQPPAGAAARPPRPDRRGHERSMPTGWPSTSERLAHHALRGEVWDKAVAYCRQAGAKALARSAYREAVACFEQALIALRHLPESRDTLRAGHRSPVRPAQCALSLGELDAILDHLREAETLAEALGRSAPAGAGLRLYVPHISGRSGDQDRASTSGQRALAIARPSGILPAGRGAVYLGLAYHTPGRLSAGDGVAREECGVPDTGELRRERFGLAGLPSVLSRACPAWCLAELGAFAEGIAQEKKRSGSLRRPITPSACSMAYLGIGCLSLRQGDLPEAFPCSNGALLCQDDDIPLLFPESPRPWAMRMPCPAASPRRCRCWSRRSSRGAAWGP